MFTISPVTIAALASAIHHYPKNIPSRWKLIAEYVCDHIADVDVSTTIEFTTNELSGAFQITAGNCRKLHRYLEHEHGQFLRRNEDCEKIFFKKNGQPNGHKPVVLVSDVDTCLKCKTVTKFDYRPSFPIIYTAEGPTVAASYHSRCNSCRMSFHYSYYVCDSSGSTKTYPTNFRKNEYLQLSSHTFFSLSYMKRCHYEICIGGISFESCATIYNATHSDAVEHCNSVYSTLGRQHAGFQLNEQRVEEAWFLYQLLSTSKDMGWSKLLVSWDDVGNRLDMEKCCRDVNQDIFRTQSKVIYHLNRLLELDMRWCGKLNMKCKLACFAQVFRNGHEKVW